jgi:hypothetical protein
MTKLLSPKITALCGLIALTATSCGNYVGSTSVSRISTSSGVHYGATADLSALSGGGTTSDGNYTCPNTANVLSNSDSSYTTSAGRYTVCSQTSNLANIKVHGTTMGSNTICVFPIQQVDSSHVYFKPDLSTGLPYASCATITSSSSGLEFIFAGMSFNAVFIVDDIYKNQMQSCLANANPGACPVYSYGQFR